MERQTGKTKDVGFQFGIRKTYSISLESAWDVLFSKKGINIWLGELNAELKIKEKFKTKNGIEGFVRVLKPYSHIRLNWKMGHWTNLSTVQIRVIGTNGKTTVSFHQEKLLNSDQRNEMKEYWNEIIDRISIELNKVSS